MLRFRVGYKRVKQAAYAALNTGSNVYCAVCSWCGSSFMNGRQCPRCGSLNRTRLFAYALLHFGAQLTGKTLVHAGANILEMSYIFQHFIPRFYWRIDIVQHPIVNRIEDLTALTFSDNSVDFVFAWHVFEHIQQDRLSASELRRVMKPGAVLLLSVPITPAGRTETYEDVTIPRERYSEVHGHPDHVRSCGLDYADRFVEIGFEKETLSVKQDVASCERLLFGLSESHVVWKLTCVKHPNHD